MLCSSSFKSHTHMHDYDLCASIKISERAINIIIIMMMMMASFTFLCVPTKAHLTGLCPVVVHTTIIFCFSNPSPPNCITKPKLYSWYSLFHVLKCFIAGPPLIFFLEYVQSIYHLKIYLTYLCFFWN